VQAARAGIATLRFVCVGTLDDLATIPPDVHIYVRSVRGDSLTERSEFELPVPVSKLPDDSVVL
jgi:hypothetical protein